MVEVVAVIGMFEEIGVDVVDRDVGADGLVEVLDWLGWLG